MNLNPQQLSDLRAAQRRCYAKWGLAGMARILHNTKEVGTLIRPEVHEQVSANYVVVHGFKLIAAGQTWNEVFDKAGI